VSFLLDTDTCSAYLKGNNRVANRFIQYGGRLSISAVSLGELFTWALRAKASSARLQKLLDMLPLLQLLEIDLAVAREFGVIDAELLNRGLSAPDVDLINAAVAIVHRLTIATHNSHDYSNIPGLIIVDWMSP